MKLKGLAKAREQIVQLMDAVQAKIDDLYDEPPQWEEKDEFYNAVWEELDTALTALDEVKDMKLENWL